MHQILIYGDSLTWGIVPDTRKRWPFSARWPGVMERTLVSTGHDVRVIEDCLNGRRTVWDDPFKPGRNGRVGIEQRIEVNSPLALVVLMLGTNDFQSMHQFTAVSLGAGRGGAGPGDQAGANRAGHAGAGDPRRRTSTDP